MAKSDTKEEAGAVSEETVARGRSLVLADGTHALAGAKVVLPADEAARLRRLGFLVDPDLAEAPRGNGPQFDQTSGPQVRRVA